MNRSIEIEKTSPSEKLNEIPRGLLQGLTPNVLRLGWVSLLADISSEMLYPIIPLFLTSVVGAPVSVVGFIEGIAEAIASLLKTISGKWSDRIGRRKPFVFCGYSLSAFARPLIALATGWPLILVSRSLDRVGKGLRGSPRDALLSESVSREHLGKAFGWHRGMDTLGAVLGPLCALGLIGLFADNLRWVFAAAFVPGILAALLVLTVKEEKRSAESLVQGKRPTSEAHTPFGLRHLPSPFKRYLFAWTLFSLTNSSDMFLLLRAKEFGFSTTGTVLLYVFYNLVYAITSPIFGQLSDGIGRKRIMASGLFVFAGVYVGFALATEAWHFWALYGVYGIYIAATDGIGKALAIDLVPASARGEALGLLGTATGLSVLVASTFAGILWTQFGSWATFSYGAIGALLCALSLIFLIQEKGMMRTPVE